MALQAMPTNRAQGAQWLINAFAVVLLTLLGAAGEQLGYDRHLKAETQRRGMVIVRQLVGQIGGTLIFGPTTAARGRSTSRST